jgi:uroporphyrinogen decarboxylase
MRLTHKERTRRAFWREPVDRLPTQVNVTHAFGEKLAAHLGVSLANLNARLDNHLVRVDLNHPSRTSEDGQTAYDWWGAGWSTQEEGYFLTDAPLAASQAPDEFLLPDPQAPNLLDEAAKTIASDEEQHFIVPNFGFCLFERAWSLRGFETFLMDLALNPTFVEELLERITEIQVALAQRFVALGVDGGYFGDDYGAQKHLLFSPKTWRALFKPRLARMFAVFREADLPVILHSDGDIAEILPDLIEIGVTVLNPAQPEVLDHAWLRRTFGSHLAFYGGVSTQTVLPHGTPAEVQAAATTCVQTLAGDGTGLLLGPSHRMMTDIPMENVDALLMAFATLKETE